MLTITIWITKKGCILLSDESKEFELSMEQKSRLLGLGLDSGIGNISLSEDEGKSDLLYDTLMAKLPVEVHFTGILPPILNNLSGELHSITGDPIRQLLLSPKTDISNLKRLKNYAKDLGTSSDSRNKKEVFLVVYF